MILCIFDLDGTLWKENSHTDILNKHFHTNFFESFFSKILRKLFPRIFQKIIDYIYEKNITEEDIKNYNPEFRKSAIEFLQHEQDLGHKVVIASNAPDAIVKSAGERLGIESYRFPIGQKHEIIRQFCDRYKYFKVVTDNVSDISLLRQADEYMIYVNHRTGKIFEKEGFDKRYFRERNGT